MSNNKIFTNTYITGSGRQNYLRIDNLEDPLFAGFTFDIDFTSSPLFYTINNSDYGYPNDEGLAERIETALAEMHAQNMESQQGDQGYDILPMLSANFMDRKKMGFGLQQNVYTDLPLYGATEYIYMVDKRNGDGSQNDVRYDSNGGYSNATNSYKLGDSVKEVVSESDREWANRQAEQALAEFELCEQVLEEEALNHETRGKTMTDAYDICETLNKASVKINGESKDYTEAELLVAIDSRKEAITAFEQFKRTIVAWANSEVASMQSRITSAYTGNACVKKIMSYDDIKKSENKEELEDLYGDDIGADYIWDGADSTDTFLGKCLEIYNEFETYAAGRDLAGKYVRDDGESFLLEETSANSMSTIRSSKIIERFKQNLERFHFDISDGVTIKTNDGKNMDGEVANPALPTPKVAKAKVRLLKELPEWAAKLKTYLGEFKSGLGDLIDAVVLYPLRYECDMEYFENFEPDNITNLQSEVDALEMGLENLRTALYGFENGEPCTSANPSPVSPYGEYVAAKEAYENDAYSQAQRTQSMLRSGIVDTTVLPSEDGETQSEGHTNEPVGTDSQSSNADSGGSTLVAPQTVLDMLGFISGMKKMISEYPYIIQGISGLDKAYNTNYMVKDPYMGSGDDKISITCFESLDLRVSSMFNRYFNAVYDRQYRRERVPINLRRFNCSIYVHDIRNFVSQSRSEYANRMLELTDMYYSAVEFRFYDCEIVPEETGNIFNDLSNEAPSEMKKTNFAFKYGNCVVNFVPQSEVAAY